MTSPTMVTRCPQCGTSFRITPAQLQSARGAVRCGACLHIFKARDHLLGTSPAPETGSALVRTPNRDVTTSDNLAPASGETSSSGQQLRFDQTLIDEESSQLDDDDFLIGDDMDDDASHENDSLGVGRQSPANGYSLFERTLTPGAERDREPVEDTDESWAMSLLEEETASPEADLSLNKPPQSDEAARPSFELVDEATEADLDAAPASQHHRFPAQEQEQHDDSEGAGEHRHAHNAELRALLMNIDPEPVEMNGTRQHRQRRKWLWGGLALVALLALAAQLAWLQFDRLSRLEPYRSVYARACDLIGCELPALVDYSRIRAYNLVVRNHPDRDDALVVDAILLNNAGFSQPFPDLTLEFSNLNDQTLAARRFSPAEYLSGELSGRETMPANRPIHLTLELVDPGEEAINYRAYIPN